RRRWMVVTLALDDASLLDAIRHDAGSRQGRCCAQKTSVGISFTSGPGRAGVIYNVRDRLGPRLATVQVPLHLRRTRLNIGYPVMGRCIGNHQVCFSAVQSAIMRLAIISAAMRL